MNGLIRGGPETAYEQESHVQPTPRQVLVEKKKHLELQLAETEEALAFFDAHADFEASLTILQKALR